MFVKYEKVVGTERGLEQKGNGVERRVKQDQERDCSVAMVSTQF